MENIDAFLGRAIDRLSSEGSACPLGPGFTASWCLVRQGTRRRHAAQIPEQSGERRVTQAHAIDIDHCHGKPGSGEQRRQSRGLDPRMRSSRDRAGKAIGRDHRCAKGGKRVSAGQRTDQRRIGTKRAAQRDQRRRKVIDGI